MSEALPTRPSLEHLRQQAKDLLASHRAQGSSEPWRLHDAQFAVAKKYGFASWPKLVHHVEDLLAADRLERYWQHAFGGGWQGPKLERARAMLTAFPDLLQNPWVALSTGDSSHLPEGAGPRGMPPLVVVAHSVFWRDPSSQDRLLDAARQLIARGDDPNARYLDPAFPEWALSALYGAVGRQGHHELSRLLIEAGADPNDNETLYHCMEKGDPVLLEMVLDAGARWPNTNGLLRLIDYGDLAMLEVAIARGALEGETRAITHAIKRNCSLEFVKRLVEAGAERSGQEHEMAVHCGRRDLVPVVSDRPLGEREELLLRACEGGVAPPNLTEQEARMLPDMTNNRQFAMAANLVRGGWPVETKGGDWNATALNHACFWGAADLVEVLLEHGARWDAVNGFGGDAIGSLHYGENEEVTREGGYGRCRELILARYPETADRFS